MTHCFGGGKSKKSIGKLRSSRNGRAEGPHGTLLGTPYSVRRARTGFRVVEPLAGFGCVGGKRGGGRKVIRAGLHNLPKFGLGGLQVSQTPSRHSPRLRGWHGLPFRVAAPVDYLGGVPLDDSDFVSFPGKMGFGLFQQENVPFTSELMKLELIVREVQIENLHRI